VAVGPFAVVVGDDFGVQGRSDSQRELLDAESVAGHLLKVDSVFAFLAAHRARLFPDEMFADLFPTGRGRPSVPADVMAAVITLQALHACPTARPLTRSRSICGGRRPAGCR
jgi:hypothetical protein